MLGTNTKLCGICTYPQSVRGCAGLSMISNITLGITPTNSLMLMALIFYLLDDVLNLILQM